MNSFLKKVFFIICLPFFVSAQKDLFIKSSWADAINLAKEKEQLLMVFISPETNCRNCENSFKFLFADTTKINRLAKQAIFYQLDFSKNDYDAKQFFEGYPLSKPTIFFVDINQNHRFPIKIERDIFDLENIYNCIFQWFRNENNEVEIATQFKKTPNDLSVLKKYLEFLNYTCQKECVESVLEEYFKAIPQKEINSDEIVKLLLKYRPRINTFYEELYFKNLQKAVAHNDLYQQLIIKFLVSAGVDFSYSKKTFSTKKILEKNSNIIKKYNKISPNFPIISEDIYLANSHLINENIGKYMKEIKAWELQNSDNLGTKNLQYRDSILNCLIQNFIINNPSLSEEKKVFLKSQKTFFTEYQAEVYYYIALKVYEVAKNDRQINFALNYSKKARNLSVNSSRLALYGLLLSKQDSQKLAHVSLLDAIELESNNNDVIDIRISNDVYKTFLNLQNTKYD
ncbi:MAG: hypothetical protein U5N85_11370 [Arcicella sp.]|nr:hypothetical protein [Arcicella sp.]